MYFSNAFKREKLEELQEILTKCLKDNKIDAIALTGTSGKVLGSLLAWWFPEMLIIICRKPGESSHSSEINEYVGNRELLYEIPGTKTIRWCFVDDTIDSGATFKRVFEQIADDTRDKDVFFEFASAVVYQHYEYVLEYDDWSLKEKYPDLERRQKQLAADWVERAPQLKADYDARQLEIAETNRRFLERREKENQLTSALL